MTPKKTFTYFFKVQQSKNDTYYTDRFTRTGLSINKNASIIFDNFSEEDSEPYYGAVSNSPNSQHLALSRQKVIISTNETPVSIGKVGYTNKDVWGARYFANSFFGYTANTNTKIIKLNKLIESESSPKSIINDNIQTHNSGVQSAYASYFKNGSINSEKTEEIKNIIENLASEIGSME